MRAAHADGGKSGTVVLGALDARSQESKVERQGIGAILADVTSFQCGFDRADSTSCVHLGMHEDDFRGFNQEYQMQITDILAQAGGIEALARETGVDESQAASGAAALLPAILGGFKKQAATQPGGVEGLGSMLERLGGERLLDDVVAPKPTDVAKGNSVLEQIFGSKDVSRAVAQNASARAGVDPSTLKKMLPVVAMMVAGYMARQRGSGAARAGGGLAGALGGVLGGQGEGARPAGGLGGLASMLDMNNDGNPLDDIMRMVNRK